MSTQDPNNPAPATPQAGPSGPTTPNNQADGQQAAQSGASGATPAQSGQTGAAQSGAADQTGPAPDTSLEKLKKAASDASEKFKKDPTPENKAAAKKAVQDAKDALRKELGDKAPEKYDLKMPEGTNLTAADLERISAEAKAKGLSNEEAQALLERDSKLIGSHVESQKANLVTMSNQWKEQASTDSEFGGEAFGQNAELAKRVVAKFATPAFTKALEDTGFGNHPELIRIFVRIGKQMTDDQLVLPNSTTTGTKKEVADVLYGATENPDNKE